MTSKRMTPERRQEIERLWYSIGAVNELLAELDAVTRERNRALDIGLRAADELKLASERLADIESQIAGLKKAMEV